MSTLKFNRKPPLAKSPIRARPRRVLRTTTSMSVQTPPGSLTKSAAPLRRWDSKETDLRPEFRSISCELRAMARMAGSNAEIENKKTGAGVGLSPAGVNKSPLFERGRFYDVYSARRNERLKRKMGIEMEGEGLKKCSREYDLGVTSEGMKRRDTKRLEIGRKSIAVDFLVDRSEHPRYSLRSSKENKKSPMSMSFDKSHRVDASGNKIGTTKRVVRKI
uniref:Uncharacterized protein n=1 Tax=Kalanchoe fedtschenkoi TaxID=63787 RepID=A0A7N0URG1_KALFE